MKGDELHCKEVKLKLKLKLVIKARSTGEEGVAGGRVGVRLKGKGKVTDGRVAIIQLQLSHNSTMCRGILRGAAAIISFNRQ